TLPCLKSTLVTVFRLGIGRFKHDRALPKFNFIGRWEEAQVNPLSKDIPNDVSAFRHSVQYDASRTINFLYFFSRAFRLGNCSPSSKFGQRPSLLLLLPPNGPVVNASRGRTFAVRVRPFPSTGGVFMRAMPLLEIRDYLAWSAKWQERAQET